jgi:hypothetical protein
MGCGKMLDLIREDLRMKIIVNNPNLLSPNPRTEETAWTYRILQKYAISLDERTADLLETCIRAQNPEFTEEEVFKAIIKETYG